AYLDLLRVLHERAHEELTAGRGDVRFHACLVPCSTVVQEQILKECSEEMGELSPGESDGRLLFRAMLSYRQQDYDAASSALQAMDIASDNAITQLDHQRLAIK